MGKIVSFLRGMAIGAGLMYFMDPQQGSHRKALVRDQVNQLRGKSDGLVADGVNDLRNRARGILAEGMSIFSNEPMPDQVLEQRVRSRMGMMGMNTGAVEARVQDGRVILEGDVLQNDAETLAGRLGRVRGIRGVDNRLKVHMNADEIPNLQGNRSMMRQGSGQLSPGPRLLVTAGAGYLLLYSIVRGGFIGFTARVIGLMLGIRAISNMNARQLTGQGIDQGMIQVNKSIKIDAPVEEVYALWSNFENFPRFMNNIESIRMMGDRSHWVVKGPVGSKVEFDAITTAMVPNELVSWETTTDSMVQHQGQVRFQESGGGTQVHVNMSYTPPAGAVGHAVASLFGKDPKTEMDADLARMKSLLEKGRTRAGGQQVTLQEVGGIGQQHAGKPSNKQSGDKHSQRDEEKMASSSTEVPVTGGMGVSSQETGEGDQPGSAGNVQDVSNKIQRDMGGGEENSHGEKDRY